MTPKSTNVLLIEDDESLAKNMVELFKLEDIDTKNVSNGYEVLSTMKQNYRPDVIVLDMNLPDRSGTELLDTLHNRWEHARIYIHSAYVTDHREYNGIVCGCFHKGACSAEHLLKAIKPN